MVTASLVHPSRAAGISVLISLAFGLGQVGIGMLMMLRGGRLGGWRSFRSLLVALFGVGFALSGLAELAVSGAEGLGMLSGVPGPAEFRQIRLAADYALAAGLSTVALTLASYPLWRRLLPIHRAAAQSREQPS